MEWVRFLRAAARHCRSRAVRASTPPALRPAREVLRLSATPRRSYRLRAASREARPGSSFGTWPEQAPRWSAERRARSVERAAAPEAHTGGNIRCVARPHGTVAPFRRSASPYFFGGKAFVALVGKPRAQVRRENGSACTIRPRVSGGGGPLELAKRANRGGGGAGLGASLP